MSRAYVPQGSNSRFYLPLTLESDFDNFLDGDLPNQVMNFELIDDWYAPLEDKKYRKKIIRGELYPDSTKSRYEDTDNNMNIRCSLKSGIKKGDIVISENLHEIFILDWEVAPESNNRPSRALRCNMYLTVKRWKPEETDDLGYLLEEEGWHEIVTDMPANAYRYDGRPEYSAVFGTPGITANALTLMTTQYNRHTKDIRIDDRFVWGNQEYTIIDVNYVGVGLDNKGTIKLQARKTSGGEQQ